ncbi:Circadian-associated transcriptional repressor [Collichthys lucidus]|uniref:Circadian-associated transcriptional repressor n=1 Tax=Collichthys lucidus TaxID=240159 RepID=A0A4U5UBE7_COLLU|nr:Circadian-associated transcriptional repressor [Collichthys lucidus]
MMRRISSTFTELKHTSRRFLSIILKIEEMLQSWFPHIKPNLTDDGVQPKRQKHHHHHHHGGASLPPPPPPPPRSSLVSLCSSDVEPASLGSLYSTTHLKWLHTSPICSLKTPESMLVQRASSSTSSTSPLPARCSQEVTQDNAVSSSTDSHKTPPPPRRLGRGRLAFKISSPCLERLLQAKESIIAPRTDGGWLS